MRFIERLRQEKEAIRSQERARQEQEMEQERQFKELRKRREEQAARLAEERRQRENKEHQLHMRRKANAGVYRNASGIVHVLTQLGGLTNASVDYDENSFKVKPADADSVFDTVKWRLHETESKLGAIVFTHEHQEYICVETTPHGDIKFHGAWLASKTISWTKWRNNKEVLGNALERVYRSPRIYISRSVDIEEPPSSSGSGYEGGRGPCLPGFVPIDTPIGLIPIKNLKIGDSVWTVDKFGYKKKARIIKKNRSNVPKNHKIAHLTLKDGRELFVSAYHPTIEGKPVISLKKGEFFDGSFVSSVYLIAYKGKYTYDILPSGDSGGYYANNIVLGSTLFNQFENYKSLMLWDNSNPRG